MRYLGNKTKLLTSIEDLIYKYNIKGDTFADLFAGTGVVGDFFKDRYSIISNDFLYYSYVINRAKLKNKNLPEFKKFNKYYDEDVFVWLNSQKYIPNENFFFFHNYSPQGDRMFFTEENAIKIDGSRIKIEQLYKSNLLDDEEYFFLLASLIESVTKVSNTSGTYEAFFKFWESRSVKEFTLEPIEFNKVKELNENIIYHKDTNNLIKDLKGDIAYIDTPYTVTQYVSAYHILETLARYDSPKIKGIGGKRDREGKNSLYAQKNNAVKAFEDLFRQLNFEHVIVSYSNQGLVSIDELVEIIRRYAINGEVNVESQEYQQYQNHRGGNNKRKLNEVLIYFKKDLTINKSPLNYSGSKDRLVPSITKNLPATIDTFVDVMGGAFNVGANIVATNKVIYNELNPYIYEIINWLAKTDNTTVISQIESIINSFNLEKGSKAEYLKLRKEYNMNKSPEKLFVLHMYSFQNMIRFNNSQDYNTPVGVAGYSKDMKDRILNFEPKTKRVELWNKDYVDINWENFPEETLFYFDPPYFITNAAYNDGKRGMKGWDADSELELLNILNTIDKLGYKFMLSNVIYHKDKTHNILLKWVEEHGYNIIDAGVSGWRYAKEEVLITNY